jgi:HEAT repeat protein
MTFALAVGLGVLCGLVWLLSLALGDRVSLYQGKPIDYWSERLNSQDATARNQANAMLNTEIIPRLTNIMFRDTNDSRLRLALVEKLNNLPGILIYCTPADSRRASAARELGELGLAARAAGPVLLQALTGNDGAVRGAAAVALGKTHCEPERVIPLLMALLDDQELNDEAAEALGEFGPLSKAAVPKLISLLKTPDKDLRHAVKEALKKIDPAAVAEVGVK